VFISLSFMMFYMTDNNYSNKIIQSFAAEGRLYNQNDSKWKNVKFTKYSTSGNDMYTSGCGIFSFCNAIYALNGNTPDAVEVATWAVNNGSYQPGNGGMYRQAFYNNVQSAYGDRFNFKIDGQYYGKITDTRLINHLKSGGVVAIHVSNHFMAVTGYNSSNNTYHVIESAVYSGRGLQADSWVSASKMSSGNTNVDWYALISNKSSPSANSGMSISGQTIPTTLKKGSFFGIYGNIKSNLPITLVWGGVYRKDWSVTSQYAEATPYTTYYSLYPYFDNNIVFNGLEEGSYYYLIKAKDTSGKEYTLINAEFTVGNPKSVEFKASTTSVSLNRSKGENKQVTFSYENYDDYVTVSFEHGANQITDCEWGEWSGNSVPLTIEGYNNGTEVITVKMKNSDTGEVIKTINITVTVTSDPFEFTASADSVNINGFESKKVTFSYRNYDGDVTIGFDHGENEATSLNWEGWKNNTDTLDIKGYANGEEIITVYLKDSNSGKVISSKKIKVTVSGIDPELNATADSVSVNMDKSETKGITFSYEHIPASTQRLNLYYEHGENRITSLEWGDWTNHTKTLYITGYRTGTENITVTLYDSNTEAVIVRKVIKVTVTGTPEIISSDDNISLDYNTNESKTVKFTMLKYPYGCTIYYVHGKNSVTDCNWNGWDGDTDTLTITPTKPGNEILTIELRQEDKVIASLKVNVKVTAKCRVYLDSNGGVVNSSQPAKFDQPYGDLPVLGRKGYIFEGWYTEKVGGIRITEDTIVSEFNDHTLYAHWTKEVIKGDCNDDGEFNVSDVVLLQRWLISDGNITLKNWKNADLYEDNILDVFDLVAMKKQLISK
ncbi:MAG: InlB B-repeat-containing protein, partial [Ruminococcus sp.]|nr:InlB B-repeat-containing protein [Ruminococcus sp.]